MLKKIDIHLHMGLEQREQAGGLRVDSGVDMIAHLEKLGIEKGIVLPTGSSPGGVMEANREAEELHRMYPEIYSFMCSVDEMDPAEVYDLIARYKDRGAVGIGELMVNRPVDDPLIEAVFEAGGKLNLPVTFHMSPEVGYSYGIVDRPGLPLLEKALKKFPDTIFMAHSPSFWIEMSGDAPVKKEERNAWGDGAVIPGGRVPELFERYSNLCGDLSANSAGCAIMRDENFGLAFLERFSDRLLFATDMVNTDMVFPLGKWLDDMAAAGKLSESAYRKIVRENAERIYGTN